MTSLPIEIISQYIQMRDSRCIRKDIFGLPKEFNMFTWKAPLAEHYENMLADYVHYYEKFVDFESTFYVNRINPPLGYIVDEELEDYGDRAQVESPLGELAKFFAFIQDLTYRYNFRVNLVCSSQSKVPKSEKEDFRIYSEGHLGSLSLIASSVMAQLLSWYEYVLRELPYTAKTLGDRREEFMRNALEVSHMAFDGTVIKKLSLEQIREFAEIDQTYALIDSFREGLE